MINEHWIDFESRSILNIRLVGAGKYAEHPSTDVLILAHKDGSAATYAWTPDQPPPRRLYHCVRRGDIFHAHNAQFEYFIWNKVMVRKYGAPRLKMKQMRCTAAKAAMCSLPRSLGGAGAAMGLSIQKDKRGDDLIKVFCGPHKPTKKDPRVWIRPEDEPEKFREFVEYCVTDVDSEYELDQRLPDLPPFEQRAYLHDLAVNVRGIPLDLVSVRKAIPILLELQKRVAKTVRDITGGINPTQREKLLIWLQAHGAPLENMQAKPIDDLLLKDSAGKLDPPLSEEVKTVLKLRVEAAKVSSKKLISMLTIAGEGRRARSTLLYYGAHTGRHSGRLLQPHNMIRGLAEPKDQIRLMGIVFSLLRSGADADSFEAFFDKPLTALAQCMRGFIATDPGSHFKVVDYAQIEARVLLWMAQQEDALQEYREYDKAKKLYRGDDAGYREYCKRTGKGWDRYALMAAFVFGVSPLEVTKEQRQIGKQLVLGAGFQLGWKRFIEYCAQYGIYIDVDMSKRGIKAFREKHDNVPDYWWDVQKCAIAAVKNKGKRIHLRNISFHCDTEGEFFTIRLPSGRCLFYPFPSVHNVLKDFGTPEKPKKKWIEELRYKVAVKDMMFTESTYGGKLVENIVQGTARDIMMIGSWNAEKKGYPLVLWVHDESVTETPVDFGSIEELEETVCDLPPWVDGCPVKAEGFIDTRYRKG